MASVTARRKCPELIFVAPRFDVYRAVSRQIHAVFERFTPLIQPLSLDEAHLDVTTPLVDLGSATAIAREIKRLIRGGNRTDRIRRACLTTNSWRNWPPITESPTDLFVITPRMGAFSFVRGLAGQESFRASGPATAAKD